MDRTFLSPGERRVLASADRYPLPDDVRVPGRYETEGDVIRLLLDEFDATLVDSEPSRSPQLDESEQLALLGTAPTRTPPAPRAYRD